MNFPNHIIDGIYILQRKISSGSFGVVYEGYDMKNKKQIAIKLAIQKRSKSLVREIHIMSRLQGIKGIPKVFSTGRQNETDYIVFELLGQSLEFMIKKYKQLSLKSVVQIGLTLLKILKIVHQKGIIHRDLKPDNILIGLDNQQNSIYLIDYGIGKFYLDEKKDHIQFQQNKSFVGTCKFASLASHKGYELSRRDDIEQLIYNLMYLYKGKLPWQNYFNPSLGNNYEQVGQAKILFSNELSQLDLPTQFQRALEYIQQLDFKSEPNYSYISNLLISIADENNFAINDVYEWTDEGKAKIQIVKIPQFQNRQQSISIPNLQLITQDSNSKLFSDLELFKMDKLNQQKLQSDFNFPINDKISLDQSDQQKADVQHGEIEIRFQEDYQKPFPLYPRETLKREPTQLQVVKDGSALKIEAQRNFKRNNGEEVNAGDQYLFVGPATYYPRVEELVLNEVQSVIIAPGEALRLRAKQEIYDINGVERKTGDEWLIKTPGSYLPQIYEEVVSTVQPQIINPNLAIQLRAIKTFIDEYGIERKAGEEYLITLERSSYHIVDIYEEFVKSVDLTVLTSDQYCIIADPVDEQTQKNRMGASILLRGPKCFFLQPGEQLTIGQAYILDENQALLVKAKELVKYSELIQNEDGVVEVERVQQPGNKWMVYGPCSYIPPVEIEVLENRSRKVLDKNEGIYVRDTKTGQVRSVIGEAYMLKSYEELWEMELSANIEKLLRPSYYQTQYFREKYQVVNFRAPFNTAVQVYDFKKKTSRIVFGPALVTLEPDEVFTQNALSGGTPKKPGVVETLALNLGPEFSTDEITVETSDHAVLKLLLAYNWHFRINQNDQNSASKIFTVKDFIGDMCNLMASKVRSAVASSDFDTFHKTSARLIRKAIFGVDDQNKINKEFLMDKNSLVITNVDIKQVEPVDAQTRRSLQKTVSMAIEISTKKQEAAATHQSDQNEQRANGELQELKIKAQLKAEESQQLLLQYQNKSKEVESQGYAKATAGAEAKAQQIIAETNLEVAKSKAQAKRIETEAQIQIQKAKQDQQMAFDTELADIEINRARDLALIESKKFEEMISAIGQETLVALSKAGPEAQAELLKGLGLSGYIFTDGNSPINLFNGAQGLIGGQQQN